MAPRSMADGATATAINQALQAFVSLSPGQSAAFVSIRGAGGDAAYHAGSDGPLFVGSAVKTFILAQYLRDVEAGRLSEDTQLAVGPRVWSPGSPVLLHLKGTISARSVLEAMIAHSDNTATDIALNAVGADRTRQLIAAAGLIHTRIPDSTRKLFSYLAGAPAGVDIGWEGMEKMAQGILPGTQRPVINEHQTMMSTAAEMAHWYERVLAGEFFQQAETRAEFKRISAMADAMPMMVPEDIMAYGKGGSIDWGGFHCLCGAGQMVQPGRRTSFCFILNWSGTDDSVIETMTSFKQHSRHVLALAAEAVVF
jgi:beta-lactamase class A